MVPLAMVLCAIESRLNNYYLVCLFGLQQNSSGMGLFISRYSRVDRIKKSTRVGPSLSRELLVVIVIHPKNDRCDSIIVGRRTY